MSIRTVARFVLKALAAPLLNEVNKHNVDMSNVVKARNAEVAKLNGQIKELVQSEDARIAAIKDKADAEIRRVKNEVSQARFDKHVHITECEKFCKHAQAKSEKAAAMRNKVLAIVE